jgi:molybdenum cofactor biosynthesis enzyme MoaA
VRLPDAVLPRSLYYYHSDICNFNCRVCCQHGNYPAQFPVEKVRALIDEVGWENLDSFGFVGGESLASADGLEFIRLIAEEDTKGVHIPVTTNCSLVDRHIDTLAKIERFRVAVSIDGYGETYEKIRNFSWQHLTSNFKLLADLNRDREDWRLHINSIVMKSTHRDICKLIDFAHEHGATIFFSCISAGHPEEDFWVHPQLIDWKEYRREILEAANLCKQYDLIGAEDSLMAHIRRMDMVGR